MTDPYVRAGNVNWIAKGTDVGVQERTLAPGQVIPWHYHSVIADTTYCLEGTVRIEARLDPAVREAGPAPHEATAPAERAPSAAGAMRRAVPSKPWSPMTRLLPPPMTRSGVPLSSLQVCA